MKAERARRENELDTQAEVRKAEGIKEIDTLKSEGVAKAQMNKADSEIYTKKLQSDAFKYDIEKKTEAMVIQLEQLKSSVGSSQGAVDYLLAMEQLKQLSNLASSKNKVFWNTSEQNTVLKNSIIDIADKNKFK